MQFVTLTSPGFVDANPWLRDSILGRQPVLPPEIRLYLFAARSNDVRSTGLLASYSSSKRSYDIFAEFAFWPLGCVLAFSDLDTNQLSPIHHWAEVPIKSSSTRDLVLRINHIQSSAALDYRSPTQIERDQGLIAPTVVDGTELKSMQAEWFRRSGANSSTPSLGYVLHPQTRVKQ